MTEFKYKVLYYCFIFNVFTGCYNNTKNNVEITLENNDSIAILINQSCEKDIDLKIRKEKLLLAYTLAENEREDSIKNKKFLKIAYRAYMLNDSTLFKQVNHDANNLSKKIKDTSGLAETHWNYGEFFKDKEIMDSAYYHYYEASKHYSSIHHDYYQGKMLFNMAFVQGRSKDYTASEKLTFQAISKFKSLNKYLSLYRCYNHLGIVFNELEEFDKAIFYHNEALNYLEKVKNKKTYKEGSFNNLSLVYGRQKNYDVAIMYLDKSLKNDSLIFKDINLYARLIDNRAYYKFLNGDSTRVLVAFNRVLKIRDSLNKESGIVISKLHLAEFYAKYKDTLKAIINIKEAYELAKKVNNNRDKLTSLKLLSKLDKMNSNKFLNEYILLADSLQYQERKIRNKFARIRFETDEYFEETQRLSEQKMWILLVSFFIIFILSLLYYIIRQQSKNKELIFEKNQQKSNEEIYSLILKQQTKLEEGRLQERNRISEDLHDGVLGKLFGTRMEFGFLNIKGDDNTLQKYRSHIKDIQQVEKEIRTISHELKSEILSSKLNFRSIIEDLVKSKSEIKGFQYTITCSHTINWDKIDEKVKINLYRIIQEALQNINKHAKATIVDLDFRIINKILKFTIRDDGIGFNVEKKKKGIGLKNIQSRTQKNDGNFEINSIINKGTIITIIIPV